MVSMVFMSICLTNRRDPPYSFRRKPPLISEVASILHRMNTNTSRESYMNLAFSATKDPERRPWVSLFVVCLAQLMIVLDVTIVNVALPAIQHDLHFSQGNLTWVVNAYMITYGSLLLFAGRLGDLIGRKRLFLSGVLLFPVASGVCAPADNQATLIVARF